MYELRPNAEKVRKNLLKHPQGVREIYIQKECYMSRSPTYKALKELEEKGLAFKGGYCLWYPENPLRSDLSSNRLKGEKNHEESRNKKDQLGSSGGLTHRSGEKMDKGKRFGARAEFLKERYKLELRLHRKLTLDEELDLKKKIDEGYRLKYCF